MYAYIYINTTIYELNICIYTNIYVIKVKMYININKHINMNKHTNNMLVNQDHPTKMVNSRQASFLPRSAPFRARRPPTSGCGQAMEGVVKLRR